MGQPPPDLRLDECQECHVAALLLYQDDLCPASHSTVHVHMSLPEEAPASGGSVDASEGIWEAATFHFHRCTFLVHTGSPRTHDSLASSAATQAPGRPPPGAVEPISVHSRTFECLGLRVMLRHLSTLRGRIENRDQGWRLASLFLHPLLKASSGPLADHGRPPAQQAPAHLPGHLSMSGMASFPLLHRDCARVFSQETPLTLADQDPPAAHGACRPSEAQGRSQPPQHIGQQEHQLGPLTLQLPLLGAPLAKAPIASWAQDVDSTAFALGLQRLQMPRVDDPSTPAAAQKLMHLPGHSPLLPLGSTAADTSDHAGRGVSPPPGIGCQGAEIKAESSTFNPDKQMSRAESYGESFCIVPQRQQQLQHEPTQQQPQQQHARAPSADPGVRGAMEKHMPGWPDLCASGHMDSLQHQDMQLLRALLQIEDPPLSLVPSQHHTQGSLQLPAFQDNPGANIHGSSHGSQPQQPVSESLLSDPLLPTKTCTNQEADLVVGCPVAPRPSHDCRSGLPSWAPESSSAPMDKALVPTNMSSSALVATNMSSSALVPTNMSSSGLVPTNMSSSALAEMEVGLFQPGPLAYPLSASSSPGRGGHTPGCRASSSDEGGGRRTPLEAHGESSEDAGAGCPSPHGTTSQGCASQVHNVTPPATRSGAKKRKGNNIFGCPRALGFHEGTAGALSPLTEAVGLDVGTDKAEWDNDGDLESCSTQLQNLVFGSSSNNLSSLPPAGEQGPIDRLDGLGVKELRRMFDRSINDVAESLGVGLTVLKRHCRALGISRWPHRKIDSLNKLIQVFQGMQNNARRVEILQVLEAEKERISLDPMSPLSEEIKVLRQAYFKANYKRRKMAESS